MWIVINCLMARAVNTIEITEAAASVEMLLAKMNRILSNVYTCNKYWKPACRYICDCGHTGTKNVLNSTKST